MKQENYYSANRDLTFYFEKVIDWERIVPLFAEPGDSTPAREQAATWRDVLAMAGEYVGLEVSRRAAEVDRLGTAHHGDITISPPMAENMEGLRGLGLMGLSLPREHGGEGLPFAVHGAVFEVLARADSAAMVQYAFYSSPASMIVRFGSEEHKRQWVPRLASGEVAGWVAMTEPEAGSDVGNVSTVARPAADGSWRITGRKQFISSGNSQIGVLLARAVPGSKGLEGLSMFVVPKRIADGPAGTGERENYVVERAEEKVCINGSPTCALVFDDTRGEIMGAPGDGWRQITSFMNEARVAVGIQSTGVAQAALVAAQEYAAQRVQMGKPIREHPLVAEMLLDMETTVAAMRALWTEAAVAYDLVQGLGHRFTGADQPRAEQPFVEARQRRLERYLRELTPLVKYYNAEEAIRVSRMGMAVFGGYGVVKDYEVERFLRDSLILPIYEGTSQIQALMAVKDLMKAVLRNPRGLLVPGGFSDSLGRARVSGSLGRSYRGAVRDFSGALNWLMLDLVRGMGRDRALQMLRGKVQPSDRDTAYLLLSAERLTRMLAHLHAGRLLAAQAERWPERRPLAERYLRRTADVCHLEARRIRRGDRDALQQIERWRSEARGQ